MALGPIEVIAVAFPGSQFKGEILPELERLVETETITVVDGILVIKDEDGTTAAVELSEAEPGSDVARLAELFDRVDGLIGDEDIDTLADDLAPGSAAAILAFEHTWMKPLRDAIQDAGGELVADLQVPGTVIEELLATVPRED